MVISEWWIEKYLKESGRVLDLRYYSGIFLEELINSTIILSQDSRSQGRDFKTDPPEYKARVFTTRPLIRLTRMRDKNTT
jgi:hypothetical protein